MTKEEVSLRVKKLAEVLWLEANSLRERVKEMENKDTSPEASELIQDMLEGDLDDWADLYPQICRGEKPGSVG